MIPKDVVMSDDFEPVIEQITFGQGSFGHRCRVCLADDYDGEIVHDSWCPAHEVKIAELASQVAEERSLTIGEARTVIRRALGV